MLERARPVRLAAMIGVLGLVVAGTAGDETQVLLALVATVPLTFFLAVAMPQRERITASLSVTIFIIVWIGMGVAHAALLRGLDHGGALRVPGAARHLRRRHGRLLRRAAAWAATSSRRDLAQQDRRGPACAGSSSGTLVVWYFGALLPRRGLDSTGSTGCCSG